VKRIVVALIEIDEEMGGHGMKRFSLTDKHDAIFSMREFSVGVIGSDFAKSLDAKVITGKDKLGKRIYGYTVIDSVRAILSFNASDYLRIYGWSSERALIFTGIRYGRSPMVAIRSHILKPAIVVYHRPDRIDELAIRLAEIEELPLIVTNLNLETMIKRLESM
jgi:putative transcriptional regulator